MARIILHGTGAGHPSGDRGASAATVGFSDGSRLLLDAGEGCSRAMIRDGLDLLDVSTVVVSHMHADHWAGIPNLVMGWALNGRTEPVDLYLPPGTETFFAEMLLTAYMTPRRLGFDIRYHELAPVSLPDGMRLRPFRTAHLDKYEDLARKHSLSFPSFGYVLECDSRKILFSQDIASEEDLRPELEGTELLICDMAHVDPSRVLALAAEHGVGRVIFTHVPPNPRNVIAPKNGPSWSVAYDGEHIAL